MIGPKTAALASLSVALIAPAAAHAGDLAGALALAYGTNPTLISQRAELRATDEGYVQAEAGFRPTINAQVSAGYSHAPQQTLFGNVETETNTGDGALSLSQPLYTGGRTTAQIRGAKAQISAGREQLRLVESQVLFGVIQAYQDVRRDREDLAVQRESLQTLQNAVDEIRSRRDAGAATDTDLTQAQAQLESSKALVASAEAQLDASVAEYVAAVGQTPGDLEPPPPLPRVPETMAEAIAASDQESPAFRQAQFAESAARAQVQQARAATRPTVTFSGGYGYQGPVVPFLRQDYQRATSMQVTMSQPIFAGGVIQSQAREAEAKDTAALLQVDAVQRSVILSVAQAWSQRRAAHLNTASTDAAVKAAQAAFDGIRVEYRAGLRQTLDVLIAQETLRDAEISLAGARHDDYVAEAGLLQAVGRLEARVLLQGMPLYRPEESFKRIKNSGSVPWQALPTVLDKIGAPALPQPKSLPDPTEPSTPVRMADGKDLAISRLPSSDKALGNGSISRTP